MERLSYCGFPFVACSSRHAINAVTVTRCHHIKGLNHQCCAVPTRTCIHSYLSALQSRAWSTPLDTRVYSHRGVLSRGCIVTRVSSHGGSSQGHGHKGVVTRVCVCVVTRALSQGAVVPDMLTVFPSWIRFLVQKSSRFCCRLARSVPQTGYGAHTHKHVHAYGYTDMPVCLNVCLGIRCSF